MPHKTRTPPRSRIQALGGKKNAHTVTIPKTMRTNPMSLASLYLQIGFLFLLLFIKHLGIFYELKVIFVTVCVIMVLLSSGVAAGKEPLNHDV